MIKLSKRILRNRKFELKLENFRRAVGCGGVESGINGGGWRRRLGVTREMGWKIKGNFGVGFGRITRMYGNSDAGDEEFSISPKELREILAGYERRVASGDVYSTMKDLNTLLKDIYQKIPRGKAKHGLVYSIRANIPKIFFKGLDKELETNPKMVHSYLNDTVLMLNKLGYADGLVINKYFFKILNEHPELILWKTKGGQYMFKIINTPFRVYPSTFKSTKRNNVSKAHKKVLEKILLIIMDKKDEILRNDPTFFNTHSMFDSILQTDEAFTKEIRDWILEELDYCLKHLVKTQGELFDLLLLHSLLKERNIVKNCQKMDRAFVRSTKLHSDIDASILASHRIIKFARISPYMEKYFPSSFEIYIEELTKHQDTIKIDTIMKICQMDTLHEFPDRLIDFVTDYMLGYLKKNKKTKAADGNMIIYLTNATAQKVIAFEKRDEFKSALVENLLAKAEKKKPDLELINSYLFCEIQTRNFDCEDFEKFGNSLQKIKNKFYHSGLTKLSVENMINLFVTFSFSNLGHTHPIFQKLCFLVETCDIKEKVFYDPNALRRYISGLHNVYCKAILKDIDVIANEHQQGDFQAVKAKITQNKDIKEIQFSLEFLNYYLPYILKIMQADKVGEGRWSIEIHDQTKHKLLSILLTMKYTECFPEDKVEHWETIISYFLKKSKNWKTKIKDVEPLIEDFDQFEHTRSGNKKFNREREISKILKSKNIQFKREKKCILYYVDFFITLDNGKELILEYDGFHHFSRGPEKVPLLADKIKRFHLLCEGYDLRVLNYTHGEDLEEKIDEILASVE